MTRNQEKTMMNRTAQPYAMMHSGMSLKVKLYVLLSIAVVFIAIIPARYVSGIFHQDATVFIVSLAGFCILIESIVWCCLSGPQEVYDSMRKGRAQPDSPDETATSPTPMPAHADSEVHQSPCTDTDDLTADDGTAIRENGENDVKNLDQPAANTVYQDLYSKGCDDFYASQAKAKKQQIAVISEYLHYIMAPFVSQDRMEDFCHEIFTFATIPDYTPKPFPGLKGTLTSFDVRHLIWNVATRLGLGRGKPYSVETCISFIRTMFPDLCEGLDPSTLKNLKTKSAADKIEIDEPGPDGISFHALRDKK